MVKCKNTVAPWCAPICQGINPALILCTVMCALTTSKFSQANDNAWQAVGAAEGSGSAGWFRVSSDPQVGDESDDPHSPVSTVRPGSVVPLVIDDNAQRGLDLGRVDANKAESSKNVNIPGVLTTVRESEVAANRFEVITVDANADDSNAADIHEDDTGSNVANENEASSGHATSRDANSGESVSGDASSEDINQRLYDATTQNIDLFVGEVRVLGEFDARRVAVGNGAVVKAEILDSGELLVIATGAGSTSVRLWNRDKSQTDYNIRVSENDPETRVQLQRMVRMRVRMVEFRKSALGSLGIDWRDGASGPVLAAEGDVSFVERLNTVTPFSAYFGIASNITSRINFMAQNGDAVTLAEPVLSALNGGEASFLAGGEVPYPSIGENGQTQIEFKEYGVKLKVAPLIDNAGNVHARVETEISQLDSSVAVQGAPGLLTRRAQTEVTVRSGETIVISGLLSSESSADSDSVPGLGRLPVIGRFFSSRNKRNTVNELVIFVTPEVIEPEQAMISSREENYLRESDKRMNQVRRHLPLME